MLQTRTRKKNVYNNVCQCASEVGEQKSTSQRQISQLLVGSADPSNTPGGGQPRNIVQCPQSWHVHTQDHTESTHDQRVNTLGWLNEAPNIRDWDDRSATQLCIWTMKIIDFKIMLTCLCAQSYHQGPGRMSTDWLPIVTFHSHFKSTVGREDIELLWFDTSSFHLMLARTI